MASLIFKDAEAAKAAIMASQKKEIAKLYEDWADEIGERAKYYFHKSTASAPVSERYYRELQKQLRQTSQEVSNEIYKKIKSNIYTVADAVVSDNVKWLESFGFSSDGLNAAFSYVPHEIVQNLITGQIYDSGWSLSSRIWGDNEQTLKDIYQVMAKGLAENKPIYEIAKDLESYVRPSAKLPWNLRMADGKKIYKKQVDYNAQRLARTLVQHGYQQSFIATTQKNPFITEYVWRSNGSRVCELCLARDGVHYKKTELPMDHPNGMCTMEPVVVDNIVDQLADWFNSPDGTYPEIDEFAEKLGYTPTLAVINAGLPNEQKSRDKDWTFKNCTSPKMTKGWEYGKSFREDLTSKLMMASDQYRAAFSKASKGIKNFVTDSTNSSYFYHGGRWGSRTISLNKDYMKYEESKGISNKYSTIFHEMGHAIDNLAPGDKSFSSMPKYGFQDAMIQDMLHIKERLDTDREFLWNIRDAFTDIDSAGVQDSWGAMKNFESTSQRVAKRDLEKIVKATKYNVVPRWGHSDSYWTRKDPVKECASELFANISSAQVSEEEMEYMKEYFPRSCDKFNEIIKEVSSKVK